VRKHTASGPDSTGNFSIAVSLTPVPLTARRTPGPGTAAYRIAGQVTFSDSGGEGGRLTSMDLDFVDADGQSERQRIAIDVTLPARGAVTQALPDTVQLATALTPVRLRVVAAAVDPEGERQTTQAGEAPLVVVAAVNAPVDTREVTFVGAGDIATCRTGGAAATARLLDSVPGEIFTLGDNVYPSGTAEAFSNCYDRTWGRHRHRTRPNPGNHDWDANAGAPYFAYFGFAAGPPGRGYYSFDLGAWHILSLNSNIPAHPGSGQYEWVRADLASSGAPCTLAYWHHPLFSSGPNGSNPQMRSIWRLLDDAGVDVVLTGHDHLYERFAPQDADGQPTPSGIRAFVVGTGGAPHYGPLPPQRNSEAVEAQAWGVLKLTLRGMDYAWEFVPAEGHPFRDAGISPCG
jgi:hypothetical protein